MFGKKKEVKSQYVELQVKLKPVFGIKPGIYLSVIYLLALVILLFSVFMLPGIYEKGSRALFTSSPGEAAVYVNGIFAGTTPFVSFIPEGENEIVFAKPGFKDKGEILSVNGYIFATLFKKPELEINRNLELADSKTLFEWTLQDVLRWSSISDFHVSYQPEYLISKTISYLEDGGKKDSNTELFLEICLKNLVREHLAGDFMKGFLLYLNSNNPLMPDDIVSSIGFALDKTNNNRALLVQLVSVYRNALNDTATVNSFLSSAEPSRKDAYAVNSKIPEKGGSETIAILGKKYAAVSEGNYFLGPDRYTETDNNQESASSHNVSVRLGKFFMAAEKVSNLDFYKFVNENEFWSKDNIEKLTGSNFADEQYLSHWPGNRPLDSDLGRPVSNVSSYAAEAYAEWLSTKIQGRYRAVIPDEYMWEAAERTAGNEITMMNLYLWDWCSNWFNTADYIRPVTVFNSSPDAETLKGIEKAVRGGSWANNSHDIKPWTRGAQPPEWCTPFTGFRVALIPVIK